MMESILCACFNYVLSFVFSVVCSNGSRLATTSWPITVDAGVRHPDAPTPAQHSDQPPGNSREA